METELEETQRQLRRSAELIQSAFEGLTALHVRITTAALMRARSGTPGLSSGLPANQPESSTSAEGNTMDPGHDAILLLSSANSSESPAPATQSDRSSLRRPRITDTTLSNLHTEILQSTESVRQRANELEELRRIIGQHNQDRHRQEAHAATPDTPSFSTTQAGSTSSSGWDRPVSAFASSLPVSSRRLLLESSLRQRNMDESATSLGAMVSARTASSPAAASSSSSVQSSRNTAPLSLPSRPEVSVAASPSSSPALPRSSASPIPAGLATRLTRLAQEIQQDITRISQQSESLMSWINENRARLEGASPSLTTNATVATSVLSGDSTPRASPSRLPALESLTNNSSPRTPPGAPRMRPSNDWGQATAVSAHPMSIRPPPPRSSDLFRAEIRRRGPAIPMSTISLPSEESDGPLARSSHLDTPTSTATVQDPPGSLSADPELVDAVSRVRGALARARYRRAAEEADREEEPADTRSYRVRRRLNADGDEEVTRVPIRRDSAVRSAWRSAEGDNSPWPVSGIPRFASRTDPPAEGETRDRRRTRRSSIFAEEEQTEDSEWLGAVRRLDALARVARESERPEPRDANAGWGFSQVLPRDDAARQEATPRYPVNLGSWWSSMPPNAQDEEEEDTREESEYERDLAAMRARALALTSSNPPLRTLSGGTSTLPPPPPPVTRPLSLLSTTQTTPSSLWNDSNVRVRLRAAVARLDEDVRALEAARERAQSQITQSQPSQPLASSESASPARPPRRPQSRFWPFDYRDLVSPSPPPERERDLDRNGRPLQQAQCGPDGTLERPMWGSPTPFYPSVLPLPLVQEVSTLEARSRAFGGAAKQIARMPRRRTLAGR
ncbi:hypothetical protein FKP32DRAFT_1760902 [Trametes sanguinea]|nr:hypothetical protein FKP32DRAFT_1760902 [Trametes sanguinea]